MEALGSVEGFVRSADGSDVIEGATVTLLSYGLVGTTYTTSADQANGYFFFSGIPEGEFDLEAQDPETSLQGHASGRIVYEGDTPLVYVYLAAAGLVRGRTLTHLPTPPTPAPSAAISIQASGMSASNVSDGDGEFDFSLVPVGHFRLESHGQPPNGMEIGGAAGDLAYANEIVDKDVSFIGLGRVHGELLDDGDPVQGFAVRLTSRYTYGEKSGIDTLVESTDANGGFDFSDSVDNIRAGDITLEAYSETPSDSRKASFLGVLAAGGEIDETLTVTPGGPVAGVVKVQTGAPNPVPVAGAIVDVYRAQDHFAASTDANGQFAFKAVPIQPTNIIELEVKSPDGTGRYRESGITLTTDGIDRPDIILDTLPPSVTGVTPANGATQVQLSGLTITLTFSEEIEPSTVTGDSITLANGSSKVTTTPVVLEGNQSVQLSPPTLAGFTVYTVTVSPSVEDVNGHPLFGWFSSVFSTVDEVAPAVVSVTPDDGAIEVPAERYPITVTFNEPVDRDTVPSGFQVKVSGTPVPGAYTYESVDQVAVFTPTDDFSTDTEYEISVSGVEDKQGIAMSEGISSYFETRDTIKPEIEISEPEADDTVGEGSTQAAVATIPIQHEDVVRVDFFVDGVFAGSDQHVSGTADPVYQANFAVPDRTSAKTTFLLEARATDDAGLQNENDVQISLNIGENSPPGVVITAPPDQSTIPTSSSLNVTVDVADDVGITEIRLVVDGAVQFNETRPALPPYTPPTSPKQETFTINTPDEISPANGAVYVTATATDTHGNQASHSIELTLVTGEIAGTVYLPGTTDPAAGVKMTLKFSGSAKNYPEVTTGQDGRFSFGVSENGSFELRAEQVDTGCRAKVADTKVNTTDRLTRNPTLIGAGTIEGTTKTDGVTNPIGDCPVEITSNNAALWEIAFNAESDSSGNYTVPKVPYGSVTIEADNPLTSLKANASGSHQSNSGPFDLVFAKPMFAGPDEVSPTSGPVEGVGITVHGQNMCTTTEVFIDGTEISCDPPNLTNQTIQCTAPAHQSGAVDVVLRNPDGGQSAPATFTYRLDALHPIAGANIADFAIQGDYLYLVQTGACKVYDIHTSPETLAATFGTGGQQVRLRGDYAYVLRGATFEIFDVSNLSNIQSVGSIANLTSYEAMADLEIQGDRAFVLAPDMLHVIDIATPASPVKKTSVPMLCGKTLTVAGPRLFVGVRYCTNWANDLDRHGVMAFDIHDPDRPVFMGTNRFTRVADLALKGDLLVAGAGTKLRLLDVSNPHAISLLGESTVSSDIRSIYVSQDKVYVGRASDNVDVIDIEDPENPVSLPPLALGRPGEVNRIEVYKKNIYFGITHDSGAVEIYKWNVDEVAPFVADVRPAEGDVDGGDTVTITGTDFFPGASVEVGGESASSVERISTNVVRAVVPAGLSAGLHDVKVINTTAAYTVVDDAFRCTADPVVHSLTPSQDSLKGGVEVEIRGANFGPSPTVTIDGESATVLDVDSSGTFLHAVVPGGGAEGPVDVAVTSASVTTTLPDGFTYGDFRTQVPFGAGVAQDDYVFDVGGNRYILLSQPGGGKDLWIHDWNNDGTPDVSHIVSESGTEIYYYYANGQDIVASGDFLYWVRANNTNWGNDVVHIWDAAAMASPQKATLTFGSPAYPQEIELDGGLLYIRAGQGHRSAYGAGVLQVADVSDFEEHRDNPAPRPIHQFGPPDGSLFKVSDGLLFLLRGTTIEVYDVSRPAAPVLKDTVSLTYHNDAITWLAARGRVCFAGTCCNGFYVVDATDPDNTVIRSSPAYQYPTSEAVYSGAVNGNLLYIANRNKGLEVWNVNNLTAPTFSEDILYEDPVADVVIDGNLAFLGRGVGGLRVIALDGGNETDPTTPTIASVSPATGSTSGGAMVSISGSYFASGASVSFGSTASPFVQVTNSSTMVARTPAHSVAEAVAVTVANPDGGTATLTGGYTYEVSAPQIAYIYPKEGPYSGNTTVTVVGSGFGSTTTVTFDDDSNTPAPTVIDSNRLTFTTPSRPPAGRFVDIVVTNTPGGETTLESAFYLTLPLIGQTGQNVASFRMLQAKGNYLYATNAPASNVGDLEVYEITGTPPLPALRDTYHDEGYTYEIPLVHDGTCYLLGTHGQYAWALRKVDVTEPTDIAPIGDRLEWPVENWGARWNMRFAENKLYLTTYYGLFIVDVSPSSPMSIIGRLDYRVDDVEVVGDTAFAVNSERKELLVIDVADPSKPKVVHKVSTNDGENQMSSVLAFGNYLYTGGSRKLTLWDITDRTSPTIVQPQITPSSLNLDGDGNKWFRIKGMAGGALFVEEPYYHWMYVFDVTDPAAPQFMNRFEVAAGPSVLGERYFFQADSDKKIRSFELDSEPAAPQVASCSPAKGSVDGGNRVVITGSGFRKNALVVEIDSAAATNVDVTAPNIMYATTPEGSAGSADVTVRYTDTSDSATLSQGFTYVSALEILGVSPNRGSRFGGTTVLIHGTHIDPSVQNTTVSFQGATENAQVLGVTDDWITVRSPSCPTCSSGIDITVTNGGTSRTLVDAFTYEVYEVVSNYNSSGFRNSVSAIVPFGNKAYAAGAWTFMVYDISEPDYLKETGATSLSGTAGFGGIETETGENGLDYAYIWAAYPGGFYSPGPSSRVFEIGDDDSIADKGGVLSGGSGCPSIAGFHLDADHIITARAGALLLFDARNLSSPSYVSEIGLNGTPRTLTVARNRAYVGWTASSSGKTQIEVYDLSNWKHIKKLDSVTTIRNDTSYNMSALKIFDDVGYMLINQNDSYLYSLDLQDPDLPTVEGSFQVDAEWRGGCPVPIPAKIGDRLYLNHLLTGLYSYDVESDPFNPTYEGSISLPIGSGVLLNMVLQGNRLFVTHSDTSLPFVVVPLEDSAPGPHLDSVEPATGSKYGNDMITLWGLGFQRGLTVTFNEEDAASVAVNHEGQISLITPAVTSTGAATIVITNPDGQELTVPASPAKFTFEDRPPQIIWITPNAGSTSGGTQVEIASRALTMVTEVKICDDVYSGTDLTYDEDDQTIVLTTEAHSAGSCDVSIRESPQKGWTTFTAGFTYQ